MDTVIAPDPTRRSSRRSPGVRAPGLRAAPAAARQRGRELRQVSTFAAIGVVSTLAYVALHALLRPFVLAEAGRREACGSAPRASRAIIALQAQGQMRRWYVWVIAPTLLRNRT
jgi:hypothetical protein